MSDINYLGSIALGKVLSWQNTKAAPLAPISFPTQDSGLTEAVDTLGVIAYYNITGRFTGTFEEIQGFIFDVNNIVDGHQISSRMLMSPFVNSNIWNDSVEPPTKERRIGHIGTNTSTDTNKLKDTNANFLTWKTTTNDKVKNLLTGVVANIVSIDSDTQLTLDANIFTLTGTNYAVTANINVKVLSFEVIWELPGFSWCNYTLSVMQVR